MNWDAIGAIGELIGAVAVVATLAYLARQIKQSTASERSTAEQAIADRLTDDFMLASTSDVAHIFHVGLDSFDSLSPEEQSKFAFFLSGWFRAIEQAHRQYRKGNLDLEIWEGYENYLRMTLNSDTVRTYWTHRRPMYNKEFQGLVESIEKAPDLMLSNDMVENMRRGSNAT